MADPSKKPPTQKKRSDKKTNRSCDNENSNDEAPSKPRFPIMNPLTNSTNWQNPDVEDDVRTPPIKVSPPSSHSHPVTPPNQQRYSHEQIQNIRMYQSQKKRPVERKINSSEGTKSKDETTVRPWLKMVESQSVKSRFSPERTNSENVVVRKKSSSVDKDKSILKKKIHPTKKIIIKKTSEEESCSNSVDSNSISIKKVKKKSVKEEKSDNSSENTETAVQTAIDRTPAKWFDLAGTTTPPIRDSPPSSANSLSELPSITNSSTELQFTAEQILHMKNFARQLQQTNVNQLYRTFNDLLMPKTYECQAFKEHRNKNKNRYNNIMCLDSTRVKLATMDARVNTGDYIHANRLQYPSLTAPCIITQGPLKSTCADFWRMIWQENTEAIFMLCKCEENGRTKCEEYFHRCGSLEPWQLTLAQRPSLFYVSHDGIIGITPLTQTTEDGIIITALKVSVGNKARPVMHFQCTKWSDCSAPSTSVSDSVMILKLMHKMGEVKKAQNSIVVHCSAGIGRSGTLVALHMLYADFKQGNPIDVNKVIRVLREARCQAVQTFDQFLFIHRFMLQIGNYYNILSQLDMATFYILYEDTTTKKTG